MRTIRFYIFLFLALSLTAVFAESKPTAPELIEGLRLAREVLTRPAARTFLRVTFHDQLKVPEEVRLRYHYPEGAIQDINETQFLLLLMQNKSEWPMIEKYLKQITDAESGEAASLVAVDPKVKALKDQWTKVFKTFLADPAVLAQFVSFNKPFEPYVLQLAGRSTLGYTARQKYNTHTYKFGDQEVAKDNLVKQIVAFIDSAKRLLIGNVFDFDHLEIRDAFIRAQKRKVKIIGMGIDAAEIATKPEIKAVYDALLAAHVPAVAVDSVGLNHQKLLAKDWDVLRDAEAIVSEGNFTYSCLSPQGDLTNVAGLPDSITQFSQPNANSLIRVKSQAMAILIQHELTKTLVMKLRGREYPLGGAYKLFGPALKYSGERLPAGPVADLAKAATDTPYVVISFTPQGALDDINENMFARAIRVAHRVGLAEFAFSSQEVIDSIFDWAKQMEGTRDSLQYIAVGETSFAMQPWSGFLAISGMTMDDQKHYSENRQSPFVKSLKASTLDFLRNHTFVAPKIYGDRDFTYQGKVYVVSAKLHHKDLVAGFFTSNGSSFNLSVGANNNNNEQVVFWFDRELSDHTYAMMQSLASDSGQTVMAETVRRNALPHPIPDVPGTPEQAETLVGRAQTRSLIAPDTSDEVVMTEYLEPRGAAEDLANTIARGAALDAARLASCPAALDRAPRKILAK